MEAEIVALAGAAAASVVQSLVTDGYTWVRSKVAAFFGADSPTELQDLIRELAEARESGDAVAAGAAEEALARRLQELLAGSGDTEARLRAFTGQFTPGDRTTAVSSVFLHYVNHDDAFRTMDAHWIRCREAGAVTAFFLSGLPGVGKTTTARRWLHLHRDVLPDDVLHADLGLDAAGRLPDPAAVLERWLDQLRAPRQDRPADVRDKAELVRRTVRGRPVVVLLENVTSAAQAGPLLPDSPGSVVLLTGQSEPPGLHTLLDAEPVRLAPLADEHALELLHKVSRSPEDPEKFRPLLAHVGRLPLLLRLLAGYLRSPDPDVLDDLVDRLADRAGRQELLHMADDSLSRSFDLVYQGLREGPALLYRRLGLHPRADLPLDAVLALVPDRDPAAVRRDLRVLLNAGLVDRWGVDAYVLHPYVHDHAAATAEREDPADVRQEVAGWIVAYYLRLAESGEAALSARWRYDPMHVYAARPRDTAGAGADPEHELGRRRAGLLAAVRLAARTGRHVEAWRLCQGLWTFQLRTASHAEWIESRRTGVESALACGDALAEARMRFEWGFAHVDRCSVEEGDPRSAREQLGRALRLVRPGAPDRSEGERRTASSVLEALGLLELKLAEPLSALARFDEALAALGELAHPRGRALLALHRGTVLSALNRHNDAARELADARERFEELGDVFNTAKCWLRYARDRWACGQLAAGLDAAERAADGMRAVHNDYFRAEAALLRGDVLRELSHRDAAESAWQEAAGLFEAAGSARADEARTRLADRAE